MHVKRARDYGTTLHSFKDKKKDAQIEKGKQLFNKREFQLKEGMKAKDARCQ